MNGRFNKIRSPGGAVIEKIDISRKANSITEYWRPETIAVLNGLEVKLVRFKGEFVWHHHQNEDELFLGVAGHFRIEFRDDVVHIGPGELFVVPRGIEHRPVAEQEVVAMLFEPAGVRNTGNVFHPTLTAPGE
jgi:mannose-6-phosphate isomerase-like protein (cupin superfamily)